jgi:hypothetical protein
MLALLKKVGENVMASEEGADAKKKAAAVCQKILDMLDDVEKAGKVCLEESIEKEKTTAALAVVSQLRGFVKSHLLKILCPPPFFGQVLSLVMALFSGCFSKNAVPAIAPVRAALPSPPWKRVLLFVILFRLQRNLLLMPILLPLRFLHNRQSKINNLLR